MKKKKHLTLKKITVANLNARDLISIKGGQPTGAETLDCITPHTDWDWCGDPTFTWQYDCVWSTIV